MKGNILDIRSNVLTEDEATGLCKELVDENANYRDEVLKKLYKHLKIPKSISFDEWKKECGADFKGYCFDKVSYTGFFYVQKVPFTVIFNNKEVVFWFSLLDANNKHYSLESLRDQAYYAIKISDNAPYQIKEFEKYSNYKTASEFYRKHKKLTIHLGKELKYTFVLSNIDNHQYLSIDTIHIETTSLYTPDQLKLEGKYSYKVYDEIQNFSNKNEKFAIVGDEFSKFSNNFSLKNTKETKEKIKKIGVENIQNSITHYICLDNDIDSSQEKIKLSFTEEEFDEFFQLMSFEDAKKTIKKKYEKIIDLNGDTIEISEKTKTSHPVTLFEHYNSVKVTRKVGLKFDLSVKWLESNSLEQKETIFTIDCSSSKIKDLEKIIKEATKNSNFTKQFIDELYKIQQKNNRSKSDNLKDYIFSLRELKEQSKDKIFFNGKFFESQEIEKPINFISAKKEKITKYKEKIKKSKDPELKSFLRNKIKKDEKCISSKKENLLKNKEEALTLALYSDKLYLSTKLPSENEYDKFEGDKFLILIIKENKESDLYSINKKTKKQQPIKMNISGEKTNFILEECSITNNNFENLKLSNEQLNVIELLIEYPLSNIKYNKELDDTNICFIDTIYAQKDFAKYTKIIEKANEEVENNNSNTPSFSPNLFDQNNGNLTNSDKELIEKKRAELEKNKKIAVSEEFKPKIKIGSSSSTGKIQKEIDHIDKFIEQKEIELANKKNNLKQLQEKQKTVKKLQIDINNINTHIQTMKDEVKKEEQDQDKLIQEKNIELRDIETENPLVSEEDILFIEKYAQIDKINSDIKLKNYEINKKTNTLTKLQKNLEQEGNIEKLQTEIDETDNFIKQKEEELNKKKSEKRKLMEDSLKNDDENVEEELTDENLETKVRRIIKQYPLQDEEQIKEIEKKVNEKKDVIIQSYIEDTEQWKKIRSTNEFTKQKEIEITNKKNNLKQLQKKHETVKQLLVDIDDINNFIKIAEYEIEKKQNEQNEELLNLKKNIESQAIIEDENPLAAKNETQFVEESTLKHNKIEIDIQHINDEINKKRNILNRLLKDLKEQGDIEKLQVEIDETDNFIKQKEEELNKKKTEKNESTKNKDESIKFTDEQIQIESSIEEDEFIKQKEIELNNEKDSLENKKVATKQLQKNIDDINNFIQIAKSQIEKKQNEHQEEVQNLKKKNDMQSMKELISKQNEINDYIKQKNNEIDKKEYKLEKFQKSLKELLTEIDNINNLIKQKEEEINKKQSEQTKPTKNKNESIQLTDENLELVEEQIQELENNDQYGMEFELDALLEKEILSFIEKREQKTKEELENYIASLKNNAKLQMLQEAEIINKLLEEIQKACFNLRENNCSYEDAWDGVMNILRSEGKDSKVFVFFTKFIENFEEEDKEKLNKIVNETSSQKKNCLIQ